MSVVLSRPGPVPIQSAEPAGTALRDLAWLIGLALLLRLAAYNGHFGTDDRDYLASAIDVGTGGWSPFSWNGSLRYGFNIPAGLYVWLFGPNSFVVSLWPLTCSLIEVGLVYVMAASVMSRRAGVFAALLLATAPLHAALATRIHADAVVSMYLTLSFVLLWFGWLHGNRWTLFACGVAIGGVFWAKELVAVTWLAFLPMLWLFRRRWVDVVVVVAGVLLMLALHGALMMALNGHPLHLVRLVLGATKKNFVDGMGGEDAAGYYLRYLFFDIRHSGALGLLALASVVVLPRLYTTKAVDRVGGWFVVAWLIGLVAVLSVFPVSLSPLRFTMKQSNYISLFLGPLAVLAGIVLAGLRPRVAVALAGFSVVFGVLVSLLQQADIRAFTANSKATAELLVSRPDTLVIATTGPRRLAALWADQHFPGRPQAPLLSFGEVLEQPEAYTRLAVQAKAVLVVLDRQTMNWVAGPRPVTEPLPCWGDPIIRLQPADLGPGNLFAGTVASLAERAQVAGVPGAGAVRSVFLARAVPLAADVYELAGRDVFCGH